MYKLPPKSGLSPVRLVSAASCEDPAGNAVATEAKAAWDFSRKIVEVENDIRPYGKDFLGCSHFPFPLGSSAIVWILDIFRKNIPKIRNPPLI